MPRKTIFAAIETFDLEHLSGRDMVLPPKFRRQNDLTF